MLEVGAGPAAVSAAGMSAEADLNLDNNARRLISAAIERAGGNKSRAARLLGITRRTLYSRLKLLGMEDFTATADGDCGDRGAF